MAFHVPESRRVQRGRLASDASYGNNGMFIVERRSHKLACMASDMAPDAGEGDLIALTGGVRWEHVSVSVLTAQRCPTWEEMCFVKSLFWDGEDVVMQLHPRESEYVNNHAFCLHLWRPVDDDGTPVGIPTPPTIFVGVR